MVYPSPSFAPALASQGVLSLCPVLPRQRPTKAAQAFAGRAAPVCAAFGCCACFKTFFFKINGLKINANRLRLIHTQPNSCGVFDARCWILLR
jgi:hypothetical protein